MRTLIVTAILLCLASPAFAAKTASSGKAKPKRAVVRLKTEEQKAIYAVGLVMARQLASFDFTPAELRLVKLGLSDGISGRKPRVDFVTYSKKSQELGMARRDAHGKKLEAEAPAYIAAAAQQEGAVKTPSGAIFLSLREGDGPNPTPAETVKINFRSALIDDREMDSTYKRGEPEEAKVTDFIKCLTEGIQLMKAGGKARLVCPPETALGKASYEAVPPNATLVYDLELVEIVKEQP